ERDVRRAKAAPVARPGGPRVGPTRLEVDGGTGLPRGGGLDDELAPGRRFREDRRRAVAQVRAERERPLRRTDARGGGPEIVESVRHYERNRVRCAVHPVCPVRFSNESLRVARELRREVPAAAQRGTPVEFGAALEDAAHPEEVVVPPQREE